MAGHFVLGTNQDITSSPSKPILIECKTLQHVVVSSVEYEVVGVFHNAQVAIPICHILTSIGHTPPPTPIKFDNTTQQRKIETIQHYMEEKRFRTWQIFSQNTFLPSTIDILGLSTYTTILTPCNL